MRISSTILACCALIASAAGRTEPPAADDAARFGALETVSDMSLSPDGTRVAFISPDISGQGAALYVRGLEEGAPRAQDREGFGQSGATDELQMGGGVAARLPRLHGDRGRRTLRRI